MVFHDVQDSQKWSLLHKFYYVRRGLLVCWKISSSRVVSRLSSSLGISGWEDTEHTDSWTLFLLTDLGKHLYGSTSSEIPSTLKPAQLIKAPGSERIVVRSKKEAFPFVAEHMGFLKGPGNATITMEENAKSAMEAFAAYKQECKLDDAKNTAVALHQSVNGGRFVFIGLNHSGGGISQLLRAICAGHRTSAPCDSGQF